MPIGVYDSGVGGVSVLRALRRALPAEKFLYVADSGHAPYGDREQDFLEARAHAVFGFFAQQGVKAAVLACNTVSVAAAAALRAAWPWPVVAMEPAIKPAVRATRSGTVLVLATSYTVASPAVARLCREHGDGVQILLQACPGLVEQVERGRLADVHTRELLETYIRPGLAAGADTLVLGCTHYAFLADAIAAIAGPGVAIVEPSEAIARQLEARLGGQRATGHDAGPAAFFTTGDAAALRAFLDRIGETAASVDALPS